MDGVCVYAAQLKMGEKLAAKIKRELGNRPMPDVVIAVPDTYDLGVPFHAIDATRLRE